MYCFMSSCHCRLSFGFHGPKRTAAGTSLSLALILMLLGPATASASTYTFTEAGVSSKGTPLLVSAKFDTAIDAGGPANALRITLSNFGPASKDAVDVLSSFYFNLADPTTGIRTALTYVSGSGQAYEVRKSGTDTAVSWTPNLVSGGGAWTTSGSGATLLSNLVAAKNDNEGWQFKTWTPPPAYPGLGYGIGTVGNSNIGAFFPGVSSGTAQFDGQVVSGTAAGSMINLGIYSSGTGTDIAPDGVLDGARVVRKEAVFTFTSTNMTLDTFSSSWIQGNVTFGFGTAPETVLLPEPGGLAIAAAGGLVATGWRMRRKTRRPSHGEP